MHWNDEMSDTEDHVFLVCDARYQEPRHQMLLFCCRHVFQGVGEVANPNLKDPGVPSAAWLRRVIFESKSGIVRPYRVDIRRCYLKVPREATRSKLALRAWSEDVWMPITTSESDITYEIYPQLFAEDMRRKPKRASARDGLKSDDVMEAALKGLATPAEKAKVAARWRQLLNSKSLLIEKNLEKLKKKHGLIPNDDGHAKGGKGGRGRGGGRGPARGIGRGRGVGRGGGDGGDEDGGNESDDKSGSGDDVSKGAPSEIASDNDWDEGEGSIYLACGAKGKVGGGKGCKGKIGKGKAGGGKGSVAPVGPPAPAPVVPPGPAPSPAPAAPPGPAPSPGPAAPPGPAPSPGPVAPPGPAPSPGPAAPPTPVVPHFPGIDPDAAAPHPDDPAFAKGKGLGHKGKGRGKRVLGPKAYKGDWSQVPVHKDGRHIGDIVYDRVTGNINTHCLVHTTPSRKCHCDRTNVKNRGIDVMGFHGAFLLRSLYPDCKECGQHAIIKEKNKTNIRYLGRVEYYRERVAGREFLWTQPGMEAVFEGEGSYEAALKKGQKVKEPLDL